VRSLSCLCPARSLFRLSPVEVSHTIYAGNSFLRRSKLQNTSAIIRTPLTPLLCRI
jgi:hypothetical protein